MNPYRIGLILFIIGAVAMLSAFDAVGWQFDAQMTSAGRIACLVALVGALMMIPGHMKKIGA